jgi:hypothetical protein
VGHPWGYPQNSLNYFLKENLDEKARKTDEIAGCGGWFSVILGEIYRCFGSSQRTSKSKGTE